MKVLFAVFLFVGFNVNLMADLDVICISDNHISIEKMHDENNCTDKVTCCDDYCSEDSADSEEEDEHGHCPTKEDCGDCSDVILLPHKPAAESDASPQLPILDFCLSLSFVAVLRDNFFYHSKSHKFIIKRVGYSPPHLFKKTTILLI